MFSLIKRFFYKSISPENFPECQDCGACCGYFKAYFNEKDNPGYKKIENKVHFVSKDKIFLKGMEKFNSGGQCDSLDGEIGKYVSCSIYEDRPDICRKFSRVLPNGKINPRCIQAREARGLPINFKGEK